MHEDATNVEKVREQVENSGVKRTAQLPTLFRRPCFVCMPAVSGLEKRRWENGGERKPSLGKGGGQQGLAYRLLGLPHSGAAGMGSGAELTC
jgi:hypothetical protein